MTSVAPQKRSVFCRVFSFPVVISAMLAVLAIFTVRERFSDPDLWWHLKTGELIWQTHSIPATDTFSFTTGNHAWTAHEWLSEAAIYGAWKLGSDPGLMLAFALVTSTLLILQYRYCAVYSGNAKVAFAGALLVWMLGTIGYAIRPHLIGYVLLTLELFVIHKGRTGNRRWFLLLPPLFGVWINCHGSFFFGLILLAIFAVCSFVDISSGSLVSIPWDKPKRDMFLTACVLSALALFVNPIGPHLVTYPLDAMFNQPVNIGSVMEWQSPNFHDLRGLGFLAVAGVVFLGVLLRWERVYLDELLLVGLSFAMAIRHQRMLFVFGMLVAPVVCRLLANYWDNYELAKDRAAPNALLIATCLALFVVAFPSRVDLTRQVEKQNPVAAVNFIREHRLSGRMLNEYVFGGYLIWALPEQKVFVDGRADIFDWTGVLRQYRDWATVEADPKALLDKYRIDYCLLSSSAPIARVLPYVGGWNVVYRDDVAVVFSRH